jgi:hypothetical protein
VVYALAERAEHRVPGFLSSRPHWVSPPAHPKANVAPLWFGGGGHTRLRERGGWTQFGQGDRHYGTLGLKYNYIYNSTGQRKSSFFPSSRITSVAQTIKQTMGLPVKDLNDPCVSIEALKIANIPVIFLTKNFFQMSLF